VNNMTRCKLLDSWLDTQSKKIDKKEKETGKNIISDVLKGDKQ
tara:strand:- start:279 stop:407 length:129 start_codon:yes stop_codon:yes gene_type:complete